MLAAGTHDVSIAETARQGPGVVEHGTARFRVLVSATLSRRYHAAITEAVPPRPDDKAIA